MRHPPESNSGVKESFLPLHQRGVIDNRLIEDGFGGKNRSWTKHPGRFCSASNINDTKTDRAASVLKLDGP